MFRKVSLLAALAVSLFAMTGCYFAASSGAYAVRGSYSTSPSASSSVTYDGPHPVFDVNGDEDWCSISGVHTHNYAPDDDTFFVVDSGRYVFVGDPSYYVSNINFNTYNYMGVHPLPVGNGWCYINGPHRHHWASSGYYNYTRVGSYNYYTYYGSRNSYYDPSHKHYDLGTYYASNPPIRYQTTYRTTVGYSRPLPSTNYSYSSGVGNSYTTVRPITSTTTTTRPVVRPSISTGSSSNGSYIRPSTGSSSNGSYIRPLFAPRSRRAVRVMVRTSVPRRAVRVMVRTSVRQRERRATVRTSVRRRERRATVRTSVRRRVVRVTVRTSVRRRVVRVRVTVRTSVRRRVVRVRVTVRSYVRRRAVRLRAVRSYVLRRAVRIPAVRSYVRRRVVRVTVRSYVRRRAVRVQAVRSYVRRRVARVQAVHMSVHQRERRIDSIRREKVNICSSPMKTAIRMATAILERPAGRCHLDPNLDLRR